MRGQHKIEILEYFYKRGLEIKKEYPGLIPEEIFSPIANKLLKMKTYVFCSKCKYSGEDEYGQWVYFNHQEHLVFDKRICEDWESKDNESRSEN